MLNKISSYSFALLCLVLLNSCKKEYDSIETIDETKIKSYLSKNNISATPDPEGKGYYYQIQTEGTGDAFFQNTDSVRYSAVVKSLENGTVYYSTPEVTNLGTFVGYATQLMGINIKGILEGMHKVKPGGTFRIFLPSYLGFGKNGNSNYDVPSNDVLLVEIKTYADSQAALDDQHILKFLQNNNLTATKDASGVYYIQSTAGTGTEVIGDYSLITTNYTGRTLEGYQFDSLEGDVSLLGSRIRGWHVLKNFKKGAKVRIFIPSVLAYGAEGSLNSQGQRVLGSNACLDFDIEITEVEN